MLKNKLKIFKDSLGVSIISNLYNLLSMNLLPSFIGNNTDIKIIM